MGNYYTTKELILFHLPNIKGEVDTTYCNKRPDLTTFPDAQKRENMANSQVIFRFEAF